MFHLKLLGGGRVEDAAGVVSGLTSRRHPVALLALLATAPSGTLSRSKLLGYLWPDSSEKVARNRLTSCLYQVRRAVGDDAVLTVGNDLRFNADIVACDVRRFEKALAAGEYLEAVDSYDGEFLDGFSLRRSPDFDQFMDRERDRLRRGYREALEAVAREAETQGRGESAVRWWRERAKEDPYDTRVAGRLMEVLAAAGNRAEALRIAREHTKRLEDEFGTGPDAAFDDLVDRLQSPGDLAEAKISDVVSPAEAPASAAVESPIRSVAVLPFENLSGTADAEPFAHGLHDDLLTELSRISALTVISRTSVLRYRGTDRSIQEIAGELGVGTVVEGGVQSAGERLRLNVQVIDVRSGAHRWVERYDRELSTGSIFDIQSELAAKIAGALEAELTPMERDRAGHEHTHDLEAYRLYAQGRRCLDQRTEGGMCQAVENFRQAIARDPNYVLAWVGFADAHSLLHDYGFSASDRVLPEAENAVRRALELDPALAEAHTSRALFFSNQRNGVAAIQALERAVELRPNYAEAHNWLSWNCQVMGHRERALGSAQRAVALDPLSPEAVSNLSLSSLALGEAERALSEARRVRELQPDWTTGAFYEGLALYHLGRAAEAVPILQDLPVEWAGSGPKLTLALAHLASDERAPADSLLAEFERDDDRYAAGVVRLALGDEKRAFEALESVDRWDYWPVLSLRHFYPEVLAPLRVDARYSRMLHAADRSWAG